jgi:hypothetical protein
MSLYKWLIKQRERVERGILAKDKVQQLKDLGVTLDDQDEYNSEDQDTERDGKY